MTELADAAAICRLIATSPFHAAVLQTVRALGLPDCWVGAGFVRNAVWDRLHGIAQWTPLNDIDVIWFDPSRCQAVFDDRLEARLKAMRPDLPWSVKNQARMHEHNGDPAYSSVTDAMRHWPETATAVAATMTSRGMVELAMPFGVGDLLAGIVRPTPHFREHRMAVYELRQRQKNWRETWPELRFIED